jgi:hypothetical protein
MARAEKKEPAISADMEVTGTFLARIHGKSIRWVQGLRDDGVIKQSSTGRYKLDDAIQAIYDRATRRQVSEDIEKANVVKVKAEATMKAAKSKIVNMEAQELSGQMHRAEDIKALTEDLVFAFRHALVSLPGRLSMDVAAAQTAPEAAAIIRREVNVILKELAQYQYDPDKYAERVRERRDWDKNDDSREDVNE